MVVHIPNERKVWYVWKYESAHFWYFTLYCATLQCIVCCVDLERLTDISKMAETYNKQRGNILPFQPWKELPFGLIITLLGLLGKPWTTWKLITVIGN